MRAVVLPRTQGLFVYDLSGAERQFFPDGGLNNVDLRPFVLDGEPVTIAGATRRNGEALLLYIIEDGTVRRATPFAHPPVPADRAAIYRLQGDSVPTCIARVEIGADVVDGVTETDGLDVTAAFAGPDYPSGLLVMMDDQNAGFTTNFRLISWQSIATQLGLEIERRAGR